jgi:hypothetical protein
MSEATTPKPTITKIVQCHVLVARDGQRVSPTIGDPKGFKFTAQEVKDIEAANPEALRDPKSEGDANPRTAPLPEQGGSSQEANNSANDGKGKNTGGASGDGKNLGGQETVAGGATSDKLAGL